jgi:hypothetical protein
MLLALHHPLRPLRALADAGRLVAAARAAERARLAHELRLRALWLRLSCVGLEAVQLRENLFASRELDELAQKFSAPASAERTPMPGSFQEQNGASAGRVAMTSKPSVCGFTSGGAGARVAPDETARREDGGRRDPGAAYHVTQ